MIASFMVNVGTDLRLRASFPVNPWRKTALELQELVKSPDALFVSPGNPLDFYIAYFARRDIISGDLVSYSLGGQRTAAIEAVTDRMATYRSMNAPIYVYGFDRSSSIALSTLTASFPSHLEKVLEQGDIVVYRLIPIDARVTENGG
jgi:hypothetical protein